MRATQPKKGRIIDQLLDTLEVARLIGVHPDPTADGGRGPLTAMSDTELC